MNVEVSRSSDRKDIPVQKPRITPLGFEVTATCPMTRREFSAGISEIHTDTKGTWSHATNFGGDLIRVPIDATGLVHRVPPHRVRELEGEFLNLPEVRARFGLYPGVRDTDAKYRGAFSRFAFARVNGVDFR